MSNNKRNKRKPPVTQSQPPSLSPKPSSRQLERLHQLVEERLNEERINRGELMTRLSGDFLSTNDLIEHIMLLMLVAEKLDIPQLLQHKWYRLDEFLEVQTKHLFTNRQFATSLLTDTPLIERLLANDGLIDTVFEYISDPIKLDERLIENFHQTRGE